MISKGWLKELSNLTKTPTVTSAPYSPKEDMQKIIDLLDKKDVVKEEVVLETETVPTTETVQENMEVINESQN